MRIGLLPLLACCLLGPASSAPAQAPRPPERLAHVDDMPKVALLPDGTLAAYVLLHHGPGLPPTEDVQRMRVRESHDNGKTWGEPKVLFELPREAGGFGLGLSIVRDCAEAIGASIHVEAAPGHGTTFKVTMPVGTYSR